MWRNIGIAALPAWLEARSSRSTARELEPLGNPNGAAGDIGWFCA